MSWKTNYKLLFRLLIFSGIINIFLLVFFLKRKYNFSQQNIQAVISQTKIVLAGDSRIKDGDWPFGLKISDVGNCGFAGITSARLLQNIDTVFAYKPDICILQVGINDIREKTSIDTVERNIQQIIEALQRHKVKPVVTSVIPIRKDFWQDDVSESEINIKVDSLNNRLIELCKQKEVDYLDLNTKLADNNRLKKFYTLDGVHLNDSGYYFFYKAVDEYLQ